MCYNRDIKREFQMEVKEMAKLYATGLSTGQIAKLIGYKTAKSVGDKMKTAGYKLRTSQETTSMKKTYDENMFKYIDASWKGYFLGLLLTDGWVTGKNTVGYSTVDRDIIDYMSMCTNKSIQTVDSQEKINPQGNSFITKTEYRLNFTSDQIYHDVQRLGVIANKSKILKGPELYVEEYAYLKDIVRGIIDGDGTLGFPSNSDKSMYFRIVSASEDFIDWCILALRILGMENLRKKLLASKMWEVTSGHPKNLAILANTIYASNYGLVRKRKLIISHYNNFAGRITE